VLAQNFIQKAVGSYPKYKITSTPSTISSCDPTISTFYKCFTWKRFVLWEKKISTKMSRRIDFYVDPEKRLDRHLIDNAAREVKSRPPTSSATTDAYFQLEWTAGCQDVLKAYHADYYSNVSRPLIVFPCEFKANPPRDNIRSSPAPPKTLSLRDTKSKPHPVKSLSFQLGKHLGYRNPQVRTLRFRSQLTGMLQWKS